MSLNLKKWTSGKSIPLVGGSVSPFIDEGDGFTNKREKVHRLLSLVAYVVGYKKMVGARNTVDVL